MVIEILLNGDKIYAKMRQNDDEKYSVQRIVLKSQTVVPPNSIIQTTVQFVENSAKSYIIHAQEKDRRGLLILRYVSYFRY